MEEQTEAAPMPLSGKRAVMSELIGLIVRMSAEIRLLQACLRLLNKGRQRGLLTECQAAHIYRISPRTLYALRREGKLPFTRFCGRIYYRQSDLEERLGDLERGRLGEGEKW